MTSTPPSHNLCFDCALSTFPSVFLWSWGFLEQLCLPPKFSPRCMVPLTHTGILRDNQLRIWMGKKENSKVSSWIC